MKKVEDEQRQQLQSADEYKYEKLTKHQKAAQRVIDDFKDIHDPYIGMDHKLAVTPKEIEEQKKKDQENKRKIEQEYTMKNKKPDEVKATQQSTKPKKPVYTSEQQDFIDALELKLLFDQFMKDMGGQSTQQSADSLHSKKQEL